MMKLITPVFFVVVAIGLFFGYIDPTYQTIKELQAEETQFDQALDQSRELQAIRDSLLSRYNTFDQDSVRRLEKLLPDNVDNVRLILDIDGIASKYNMRTRDVTVSESSSEDSGVITANGGAIGSVVLSFSVIARYDDFINFLKDLESSLRIVDVIGLSFNSKEGDAYNFSLNIKTYWLK